MSFIYPRVIAITRPTAQTGIGAVGYGGNTKVAETPIVSGIPASIQLKKEGSAPPTNLPGDVSKRPFYLVMIPLAAVAFGIIKRQDIVTDELGNRYQVQSDYWNSLGYALLTEELRA